MEASIIEILVQSGLAGVALSCLFIIYKMQNGQRAEQNDVIKRNTEAFVGLQESNVKHSAAIDRLTAALDRDRRRN